MRAAHPTNSSVARAPRRAHAVTSPQHKHAHTNSPDRETKSPNVGRKDWKQSKEREGWKKQHAKKRTASAAFATTRRRYKRERKEQKDARRKNAIEREQAKGNVRSLGKNRRWRRGWKCAQHIGSYVPGSSLVLF